MGLVRERRRGGLGRCVGPRGARLRRARGRLRDRVLGPGRGAALGRAAIGHAAAQRCAEDRDETVEQARAARAGLELVAHQAAVGDQAHAAEAAVATLHAHRRVRALAVEREVGRERRHQAVLEPQRQDLSAHRLEPAAVALQVIDVRGSPELGHRLHDRAAVVLELVLAIEVLATQASGHPHALGQVVVRSREHHQLLAARELAARVGEDVVEALAELELQIGEHRGLERAGQLERARDRELVAVDAQALAAADLGQAFEHRRVDLAADAHGEQSCARTRHRPAHAIDQGIAAALAAGCEAVADVDDGGLFEPVHTRERGVEDRAQIGRPAGRVLREALERGVDGLAAGLAQAGVGVEHLGLQIRGHHREAIAGAETAQQRLGSGDAREVLRVVAGGRGVDHDHDLAGGHGCVREVEIRCPPQHGVAALVAAGIEQRQPHGLALHPGLARQLELEVGARYVTAAPHGHARTIGLEPRLAQGRDVVALGQLAELDLQRELFDGQAGLAGQPRERIAVAQLAFGLAQQLLVTQHDAARAQGGHGVDARAHGVLVDPRAARDRCRGAPRSRTCARRRAARRSRLRPAGRWFRAQSRPGWRPRGS
ncbi:MAG: hypothetical protein U0168_03590 [Nannocystaceae bacterium]